MLVVLGLAAHAQPVVIPLGLDAYMPVPESNPLTAEKIALGKKIFFDKRVSADGTIACATCHQPAYGFTDNVPRAVGIRGQVGPRRSPRITNRGYGRSFFWDGRAATLEDQVTQPISNPLEMDSTPADAARRLGISQALLRDALASYVRSLTSGNSRYDRYLAGDSGVLRAEEKLGLKLFTGKAGCSSCHVGPNLTDEKFHNTGAGKLPDEGRAAVTGRVADRGAFKTPSLRDVAHTPPFLHDGSMTTLDEVIRFYDEGGRPNAQLDPEIRKLHLSDAEKAALKAFLFTLEADK
ncbi:MAG: c-type cytochrome [Acidobacteria bacterium]|nr:c-type cytochrome [Acidobacteriota bacterium]